MSYEVREANDLVAGSRRDRASACADLSQGPSRPAAGLRGQWEVSGGSPLARLPVILRVLPRRQRGGTWGQPSDRMDGNDCPNPGRLCPPRNSSPEEMTGVRSTGGSAARRPEGHIAYSTLDRQRVVVRKRHLGVAVREYETPRAGAIWCMSSHPNQPAPGPVRADARGRLARTGAD